MATHRTLMMWFWWTQLGISPCQFAARPISFALGVDECVKEYVSGGVTEGSQMPQSELETRIYWRKDFRARKP
jgi:hypothetical protein